jgi:molecular chaperone DnaK (HSP70)
MNIYDSIVKGIDSFKSDTQQIENYLQGLQGDVRMLRKAYRSHPVHVAYEHESVQNAYLITYLPHYYQLIHKILLEQKLNSLEDKKHVNLVFIGGGPGSEVYGALKYILSHQPSVRSVNVNIFDINSETWKFSHNIVQKELIQSLGNYQDVKIKWSSNYFNLVNPQDVEVYDSTLREANLVVIQNCINEIEPCYYQELSKTIQLIFSVIPTQGSLLMIDLTSSVRSRIKVLEQELLLKYSNIYIQSTLNNSSPSTLVSVNSRPSDIIQKNLLTGADGLIPRKNLSYDYSLISKVGPKHRPDKADTGLGVLYKPLFDESIAGVEEVNTRAFIGLDFGTSVTVCSVAYLKGSEMIVKTIPIEQKGIHERKTTTPLVPSVMGIYQKCFMLGKYASEMKPYLVDGQNLWHSFKNKLGNLESNEFENSIWRNNPKHRINNAKDALVLYLQLIYKQISKFLIAEGLPTTIYCTVSVPANYPSRNKAELRECLNLAGFSVDDSPFAQEPISALISAFYSKYATLPKDEERNVLILDLGAGTVDVSILRLQTDSENINSKLLSVQRIDSIGGDVINNMILERIKEQHIINPNEESKLLHVCEELKIMICKDVYTDRTVNYSLPPKATSGDIRQLPTSDVASIKQVKLSFKEFAEIMTNYWCGNSSCEGIEFTIIKALEQAKIEVEDIDEVILSGGGARNPYIKNYCSNYFSSSNIIIPDNIQEQVAIGNAIQSLVMHAFGKNIINSIVYEDVYVKTPSGNMLLFKAGIIAPTLDLEVDPGCITDNRIKTFWGSGGNSVEFLIPEGATPKKIFFYITSDLDLKCELLLDNKIVLATEIYKN